MFSAVVGKVCNILGSLQTHPKGYIYCQLLQVQLLSLFFSDCEATFKGRFKLREHLRSHTQEKIVACPTCGGMFANNTKFFDHIRRQTTIEGIGRNFDHWIAFCVVNKANSKTLFTNLLSLVIS